MTQRKSQSLFDLKSTPKLKKHIHKTKHHSDYHVSLTAHTHAHSYIDLNFSSLMFIGKEIINHKLLNSFP